MDTTQKFWLIIWGMVAATVLTLILSLTIITLYEDHKVAELIAAGKPPMEASCAVRGFGGGGATSWICAYTKEDRHE